MIYKYKNIIREKYGININLFNIGYITFSP